MTVFRWLLVLVLVAIPFTAQAKKKGVEAVKGVALDGLVTVSEKAWDETAVRNVLQAFAFGGHATETQILSWALMKPERAIQQMLTFDPVNRSLSDPGVLTDGQPDCSSLLELQEFWSSDNPSNPTRVFDRPYFDQLREDSVQINPLGTFLAWPRAMHTRGCNLFLHKTAFYLTNYHAAIHIGNAGTALIRDYYDDTVATLASGGNFIDLMYNAASNGALAVAYGHTLNYVDPRDGTFSGNDDFAREYFQLLFSIEGTTEIQDYHEGVSIENNARLLTGMLVDVEPERFGSTSLFDWLLTEIDFSDHQDSYGRQIYNRSGHFDFHLGEESCLEILHEPICGPTADAKLHALGPVAAGHPESMANTPLKFVRFFADSQIDPVEEFALQSAWVDANFDVLRFLRAYAVSTLFHSEHRFKYLSSFERNLLIHNANILDSEESFARPFFNGPALPMYEQGALVFSPIRDVFGGQTGNDAANDRFLFKNAWGANVDDPDVLGATEEYYFLADGGELQHWKKDWSSVIPLNLQGEYKVGDVAEWLWQRFIADGGRNFDTIARANVYSLLATGFDFAAVIDRDELDAIYTSAELESGYPAQLMEQLAQTRMNFDDPEEQARVGMAVNFISMMPYTFGKRGHGE